MQLPGCSLILRANPIQMIGRRKACASVLLIRHYETRKHPAAASWFMTPGRQTAIPEGRTRPAKVRGSGLVKLLALPGLVFLAGGAIAQAQDAAASLPPIESIGPGSDIRPFLASGVPADLARAVLRRAWSIDPAIRDFIGLSENSWDFNLQNSVPGFGSLATDDPGQLLARMTGETESLDTERRVPIPILEASQLPNSARVK
jgi:hypothetical protein